MPKTTIRRENVARSLRVAKWFLACLIGLFIISTGYISALIIDRQEALGRVSRYNTAWLASQAVAEFLRLEQRLVAFTGAASGVDKEEVQLRFEILVNRTKLLQDGEFEDFLNQNPDQRSTVSDLISVISAIDPILSTIDKPDETRSALDLLTPLDRRLVALASAAHQFGANRVAADQSDLVRLNWLLVGFLGGLVACGITLTILLLWQNRLLDKLHLDSASLASQLQTKTFLLETTLANIDQGLLVLDKSGAVSLFNPRIIDLLNLPREFLEKRPTLDRLRRLGPEQARMMSRHDHVNSNLNPTARDSQTEVYELEPTDGVVLEVRTVHLPDGSAVYTYTDVTDRKAAEVAKDNFLATMSHEIRTPLTGLLGMADLMSHEILTSKQRGYLASIQSSGRHLLAIVNDILDFSRIEASKLKLEQVEFSISALMEDIGRLMKPQAEERGLKLTMTSTGALPAAIVGDPTRLAQVLLNLIGNGIKFTDSGEVAVQFSCSRVNDELVRIRFDVVDTGCGIAEEVRSELFDPFVQSDSSPTRQHGGSGLGLAISQRLVELMGDTIRIESSVGHGSRFWFEIITRVGSAVTRVGAVGVGFVDQYPARILVAEDVDVNRRVLAEILRRCGHEITLAVDGREAVELAIGGQFDAILLDIQMPIMDGVEAARRIRAHFGVKGGPRIIGLTAFALPDRIQSYLAAGLDECLLKPIDWEALFAAISRATRIERSAVLQRHVLHPVNSYDKVSLSVFNPAGDLENPFLLSGGEEFVGEVLRDADHILTTLASLPVGSVQFAELVHKLKGTTGLVGLRRVSDLTERLLIDGRDEDLAAQVLAEIRESLADIARQLRLSDVLEDI